MLKLIVNGMPVITLVRDILERLFKKVRNAFKDVGDDAEFIEEK